MKNTDKKTSKAVGKPAAKRALIKNKTSHEYDEAAELLRNIVSPDSNDESLPLISQKTGVTTGVIHKIRHGNPDGTPTHPRLVTALSILAGYGYTVVATRGKEKVTLCVGKS